MYSVAKEGRAGLDNVLQLLTQEGLPLEDARQRGRNQVDEGFARTHADALSRFFEIAAEAKDILAHSGADWEKIAQRIGIAGDAELALYRQTYIDGIPRRPVAEEAADARALYRILAKIGGPDLAGNTTELDEGTFYQNTEMVPQEH